MTRFLYLFYTCILFIVLTSLLPSAESGNRVVVLANSIDGDGASEFYGFLGNNGMEVVVVDASNFSEHSWEKFIVILGGQNSPEGVGDIVGELLSDKEEQTLIVSSASRNMFVKPNVWRKGQVVRIFAGYGKEQTKASWRENKHHMIRGMGSTSTTLGYNDGCSKFCVSEGYESGVCRLNPGECRMQGSGEVYKKKGDTQCRYRTGHKDTCCCVLTL